MSAHTPGPWLHAHREGDGGYFNTEVFSADDSLGVIATCAWVPHRLGNGVTGTYREANARLIAAAPDMLEALRKAVVLLAGVTVHAPELEPFEVYEAVSAAIEKATRVEA